MIYHEIKDGNDFINGYEGVVRQCWVFMDPYEAEINLFENC
jgi:hypothetical protein